MITSTKELRKPIRSEGLLKRLCITASEGEDKEGAENVFTDKNETFINLGNNATITSKNSRGAQSKSTREELTKTYNQISKCKEKKKILEKARGKIITHNGTVKRLIRKSTCQRRMG